MFGLVRFFFSSRNRWSVVEQDAPYSSPQLLVMRFNRGSGIYEFTDYNAATYGQFLTPDAADQVLKPAEQIQRSAHSLYKTFRGFLWIGLIISLSLIGIEVYFAITGSHYSWWIIVLICLLGWLLLSVSCRIYLRSKLKEKHIALNRLINQTNQRITPTTGGHWKTGRLGLWLEFHLPRRNINMAPGMGGQGMMNNQYRNIPQLNQGQVYRDPNQVYQGQGYHYADLSAMDGQYNGNGNLQGGQNQGYDRMV